MGLILGSHFTSWIPGSSAKGPHLLPLLGSLSWDLELLYLGLCLVHARQPSFVGTANLPGADPCYLLLPSISGFQDCLHTWIHCFQTFPYVLGVNSHLPRQDQRHGTHGHNIATLELLAPTFGLLGWASSSQTQSL